MKWCLVLLFACSSSSSTPRDAAPAPAPPDTAKAAVHDALALLDSMATTLKQAGDCAGEGKALRAWLDAHVAERSAITARLRAVPRNDLDTEITTQVADPAHMDLGYYFMTGAKICNDDPTFARAWTDMQTMFLP